MMLTLLLVLPEDGAPPEGVFGLEPVVGGEAVVGFVIVVEVLGVVDGDVVVGDA
jgi:hypothetical protein